MAGIIANTMETEEDVPAPLLGVDPQANPVDQPGTALEPAKTALDPATDTVQGRVESLIAKNSAPMQSVATRAKQAMARSGLVNTSMAIGAGQRALYDYAAPIAAQDAKAMQRQKEIQLQTESQSRLQSESGDISRGLQELRGTQATELTEQQAQIEQGQIAQRGELDIQMQQLRGTQATDLSTIENKYRTLMQANASAAQFLSQTSQSIGDILSNPDMTLANKEQLVQKQVDLLENGLSVMGSISNLDLTSLLDFSALSDTGSPVTDANGTAAPATPPITGNNSTPGIGPPPVGVSPDAWY
jgi:hypothetical protein